MHCFRLTIRIVLWTAIGFSVGLITGCEKEEAVRSYPAPKEPQLATWTLPDGWQPTDYDKKMQFAGFVISGGESPARVTVSFLYADSPQARDLLANVNRWRTQLKLPAVESAALSRLVQANSIPGMTAQWVDMTGDNGRMRAAILPREDRVWFFKMTGSAEQVESQKDNFEAFVKSAHFLTPAAEPLVILADAKPTPALPHPEMANGPIAPPPTSSSETQEAGGLVYKLPADWSQQPNANAMRKLTLKTGGAEPAEIIVTELSSNFGGMAMNINRWRGEVGLPPVENAASVPESPIRIGSVDGALMDFSGPGKTGSPVRSLVARRTQGESAWFFKILGPAQTVAQQRPAFEEFLASVKLPGEEK